MNLSDFPHRRYNPLTDEWVLCSPHRTKRPWQGQVEMPPLENLPRNDPKCYLCPGNDRAGGMKNPAYHSTFVFTNDFASLIPGEENWIINEGGLIRAHAEPGTCRVICFSPRHDLTLPLMELTDIRNVVNTWANEFMELSAKEWINYVQIFENKGSIMGCSNPHPHCQIWSTNHIPLIPAKKLAAQKNYAEKHGSDLLGDYLTLEIEKQDRIICRNEHWVALVPFWAVWPYETMLIPVRRVPDLPALMSEERDALSDMIKRLTTRYDNVFNTSFPYSMGWHSRPTDGREYSCWRLHAVYYPPLLRSSTIKKFLVGYEMTAEPQRDITPEQAAARLREMSEVHFLQQHS